MQIHFIHYLSDCCYNLSLVDVYEHCTFRRRSVYAMQQTSTSAHCSHLVKWNARRENYLIRQPNKLYTWPRWALSAHPTNWLQQNFPGTSSDQSANSKGSKESRNNMINFSVSACVHSCVSVLGSVISIYMTILVTAFLRVACMSLLLPFLLSSL